MHKLEEVIIKKRNNINHFLKDERIGKKFYNAFIRGEKELPDQTREKIARALLISKDDDVFQLDEPTTTVTEVADMSKDKQSSGLQMLRDCEDFKPEFDKDRSAYLLVAREFNDGVNVHRFGCNISEGVHMIVLTGIKFDSTKGMRLLVSPLDKDAVIFEITTLWKPVNINGELAVVMRGNGQNKQFKSHDVFAEAHVV